MVHFFVRHAVPTHRADRGASRRGPREDRPRRARPDRARRLPRSAGQRRRRARRRRNRLGLSPLRVKAELFAEVFRRASQREVDAAVAAGAGPGPATQRLAAAVETFARRALRGRRLAWALLAEPVDPAVEAERLTFRRAYRDGFAAIVRDGVAAGELPPQDADLTAAALVGAIGETLVGPLSPGDHPESDDELVSALVRFCIRSVTEESLHGRHLRPVAV